MYKYLTICIGNRLISLILIFTAFWYSTGIHAQESVLIPAKSTWKYLDDGTNPGNSWNQAVFDDSKWKAGKGILGYGETDQNTVLQYGSDPANKYITYYFRTSFESSDVDLFRSLIVKLLRDDGAVVYLNGTEIILSNMPAVHNAATTAIESVGGTDERTYLTYPLGTGNLINGRNLVAVEVHQQSASSSDLSFDLEMTGYQETPVKVLINEVMASNPSTYPDPDFNQFSDWIELFNAGPVEADLTGYHLTDNLDIESKWAFPAGTLIAPGGYLVINADSHGTGLHANFQLSRKGEEIGLFDAAGVLADSLTYPELVPGFPTDVCRMEPAPSAFLTGLLRDQPIQVGSATSDLLRSPCSQRGQACIPGRLP